MSFKASPSPGSFLACSYSFRKHGDQLARLPPRHGSRRRALPDWWRDDPGLRGNHLRGLGPSDCHDASAFDFSEPAGNLC